MAEGKSSATALGSLALCGVCNYEFGKYRCPLCAIRSCSVACVKEHKRRFDCCGKARPFKANTTLADYSIADLEKDYGFLERCSRQVESSVRVLCRHAVDRTFASQHRCNPAALRKLCEQRAIKLLICPGEMTQRKENTTVIKKSKIYWRIRWRFISANQVCVDEKLSEENTFVASLQRILKNRLNEGAQKLAIKAYIEAGINNIHILFKDSRRPSCFYDLPIKAKIREGLKGMTVIEFPEFLVVLAEELENYTFVVPPNISKSEKEEKSDDPDSLHSITRSESFADGSTL